MFQMVLDAFSLSGSVTAWGKKGRPFQVDLPYDQVSDLFRWKCVAHAAQCSGIQSSGVHILASNKLKVRVLSGK